MEWDPNERDAWVSDAQRWISSIKGVLQCKIDLDSEGEISGVHVVAGMDREPRHIVRDVESLLKARLEIDVFYKKIGVVQVLDNDSPEAGHNASTAAKSDHHKPDISDDGISAPSHLNASDSGASAATSTGSAVTFHPMDDTPHLDDSLSDDALLENSHLAEPLKETSDEEAAIPPAPLIDPATDPATDPAIDPAIDPAATLDQPAPIPAVLLTEEGSRRVICSGVGVMASDMLVRAEVQLSTGDMEVRGNQEGANHAGSAIHLVARATLDALMQLVEDPILLHLNEVRIDHLGKESVVLCAVDLVEGRKSETLFGSCSNLHNEQQAVVFAVMDALNRRLSLYSLKSAQGEG